mmetsp:Transcript_2624/g.6125  ORF Transcript_2624/g.6125 Transcript_2624/m.6125 type:complete len:462 (+) Transcript_2624:36-1421(+)
MEAGEGITRALLGIVALDVTLYSLALPYFPAVLDGQVSERAWMHGQALSNALAAVAGLLAGTLSDWLGRKRLLIVSQLMSVVCWALMLFGFTSRHAEIMLFAFVLRKCNRTFPLACSFVTDVTPSHETRQKRLSHLGSMFGLGFALGPAAAGLLSKWYSVTSLFTAGFAFAFTNLMAVMAVLPDPHASGVSVKASTTKDHEADFNTRNMKLASWTHLRRAAKEPNLLIVLVVHAIACMGQFSYITTMAVAARDRFHMDSTAFGTLLTFLGISYSFCLWFIIPPLSQWFGDLRHLLVSALIITCLARFYVARLYGPDHVPHLFMCHAVVAVGTSGITFVIADMITSWGRKLNLIGILVGTQDSVQRVMGVVAPLLLASLATSESMKLPNLSEIKAVDSTSASLFLGAQVSAIMYLVAAIIASALYIAPVPIEELQPEYQETSQRSSSPTQIGSLSGSGSKQE